MKLKQYTKYKESGIDWIGKIPESWNIKKVKHFSISIAGGTPDTNNMTYWDGKIPWLPSGMIHDNTVNEKDIKTFITIKGLQNSSTKWIKRDAVLVALTGATCANIAYLTFRATANQSVIGIECDNKSYPKFLFYYLLSQREQILLNKTGGAQAGINKEDVKNLICAYPEKGNQTQIADFLDKKTTDLNDLLERDRRLIKLLTEKRIALINQVVTKGLNPKAKFKDSGIDWIGKIPEGWKIKRLKFLLEDKKGSIKTGPFGSQLTIDEMEDEDYKIYNQKNVIRRDENSGENYVSKEKFKELIAFKTKPGDLLITTRGTIGRCLKLSNNAEIGILHPCLMKVNMNEKLILDDYMAILIEKSSLVNIQFMLQSCATTIEVIYQDNLKEISIPVPSLNEQKEILIYLYKATSKIDEAVKKIENRIELLEEYKKSLIHNVVTGKVDVGSI